MHVAYVTQWDPENIHHWSGTLHHIPKSLRQAGAEVSCFGNLHTPMSFSMRLHASLARRWGKHYFADREPAWSKNLAAQLDPQIQQGKFDAVVCPHLQSASYLKSPVPLFYWGDATFRGLMGFYSDYSNLYPRSARQGPAMDGVALKLCRGAIFASEWARSHAMEDHGLPRERSAVVPYGANLDGVRDEAEVLRHIEARPGDVCRLLFVGKVWSRKGGELVLETARILHESGRKVELWLVGSLPDDGRSLPEYVHGLGFVSKAKQEGRELLEKLFRESHFLFVPSRAEAYGIVFCEASSFGLPSLTCRVGGIPTVVQDGKNGQTFEANASPREYADYISRSMDDYPGYLRLARSSFGEFRERLNWGSAGKAALKQIEVWLAEGDSSR